MDVVVCSFDVATAHSPSLSQVWQITTWSFNGLSAGPRGGAEAKGWAFFYLNPPERCRGFSKQRIPPFLILLFAFQYFLKSCRTEKHITKSAM